MNAPAPITGFSTANVHALATILEASETRSIIASRDIFDISGTKLWARDQPVSQSLQRKLLDRQLRQPLESCLLAEDGITAHSLVKSIESLLASDTPLAPMLRPYAEKLVREVARLPLHSVAQLLLTASEAARPESFEHAVQAMALNGALTISHGGSTQDLRLALLCGLVHDLGEMYIDPMYGEADADRALDFQSYQQLVVHPHVGNLLIEQLTDYPPAVARAVAEHHERLDGTGYPHCLQRDQVSPLGQQLAVTEATLGVLRGGNQNLSRASVALRVVPGEYNLSWVGMISDGARSQPGLRATLSIGEIQTRLSQLEAALQLAQDTVGTLTKAAESENMKGALTLAQHLLDRLRKGWNSSGLWCMESVSEQDAPEVEAIEDELLFRLRSIQRAALLRARDLPLKDSVLMNRLRDDLINSIS
ncbi:MAG: HD domain-containing protein [Burkholderiaceae bacterium]|nr:HD domain-containing protein [Burkholderiaceae bacterium]